MVHKDDLQKILRGHRQSGKADEKIRDFSRPFEARGTHMLRNDKIRDAPPNPWKAHAAIPAFQDRNPFHLMPVMVRQKILRRHAFSYVMHQCREADNKIFYWEHLGLVADSGYIDNNLLKLREYEQIGITPWNNLIITYDQGDGGIDVKIIDAMIQGYLL